jgi:ribosomal protein L20|uniref:Large ribosomal subunit protein bL20c n=1 Tax=Oryza nivara TaxID=4536 RepID=A0A0E0FSR8_ORYNI
MNKGKIFKLAKGFRGRAKNCIRIARERVEKALQYSYRDRHNKKRDMRSLWIERINAGTRLHGVCIHCTQAVKKEISLVVARKDLIIRRSILCLSLSKQTIQDNTTRLTSWSLSSSFLAFDYQVNYGNFMHGLMKENIQLNRKVLSELSMHEPYSFKALVDVSRSAFPGNRPPVKKEGLAAIL